MKMTLIASLVSAQILAIAQPARAADFAETENVRTGAFAGIRLRMPLGADPQRRGLQAGLALAPVTRATGADGRSRTGIGEGLELGFRQREPIALRLAGTRLDRIGMAEGRQAPDGQRHNVSTVGWIAIAVGATVAVVAVAGVIVFDEIRDNEYDD